MENTRTFHPQDVPLHQMADETIDTARMLTRTVSWQVMFPEGETEYKIDPQTHVQLALAAGRTQLANERTFLAWIRTTTSLLVLGIAIDRLADEQAHFFDKVKNRARRSNFCRFSCKITFFRFQCCKF